MLVRSATCSWLGGLLCLLVTHINVSQCSDIDGTFENVKPTSNLVWHPCDSIYLCARLLLPLDTDNSSLGDVAIAMIMLPGAHGDHASNFTQSPLLINPGGPGGSGVEFMFRRGQQLRTILGPSQDILAFDPRGIAHSTPLLDCFAGPDDLTPSSVRRELWQATRYHIDPRGVDDEASLGAVYQRNSALSQLCHSRDRELGASSIFKFASTPYVAGDMIGIQDAWTRWRDGLSTEVSTPKVDVDFWGFSYGSLLGATFAAIFPDRVGRVIIDGVVDSQKWYNGQLINDYVDSEKVLTKFTEYCAAAGKRCGFYKDKSSARDIETRLFDILEMLKRSPMAMIDTNNRVPAVITHDYVRNLLFESLYKPMQLFPQVADWLAVLESKNDTRQGEVMQMPDFSLANKTTLRHRLDHTLLMEYNEANNAVLCGDQLNRVKLNMKHVRQILHDSQSFTNFTGNVLRDVFGCTDWKIKPKRQLPDALIMDTDGKDFVAAKTKNPILIMNPTLDPICPLRGAVAMVPRFVNAALIEVKSEGHCSVSRVSLCAAKAVRRFFEIGETPATDVKKGKWLHCESDETPWFPYNGTLALGGDERQIVLAKGDVNAYYGKSIVEGDLAEAWRGLNEDIQGLRS